LNRISNQVIFFFCLSGIDVHRWINYEKQVKEPIDKINLSDDVPNDAGQTGTAVPTEKRNQHLNLNNMETTSM